MKLAVTDACIFIDLIELKISSEFFNLGIEIHTSLDVFNELYTDQKELLKAYKSVGKLTIHNITSEEKESIQKEVYPKPLSDPDKTVIFLADKLGAMIISSDKPIRKYAKTKSIEYHGMLWIFDMLIDSGLISTNDAIAKLNKLFTDNIIYRNNAELEKEKTKRTVLWKKKK